MDITSLQDGLEYRGEVRAVRQRYFVFEARDYFFVVAFSLAKAGAGNFNLVPKQAVSYVHSRFAGKGGVTAKAVVKRAGKTDHAPDSLRALNVLYVLVSLGGAKIEKRAASGVALSNNEAPVNRCADGTRGRKGTFQKKAIFPMASTERRYSKEEIARRGDEIYERDIQPRLKPEDKGKFVAIDIETGDYEIADEALTASDRLRDRVPRAQTWLVKVGSRAVFRFGGHGIGSDA